MRKFFENREIQVFNAISPEGWVQAPDVAEGVRRRQDKFGRV